MYLVLIHPARKALCVTIVKGMGVDGSKFRDIIGLVIGRLFSIDNQIGSFQQIEVFNFRAVDGGLLLKTLV